MKYDYEEMCVYFPQLIMTKVEILEGRENTWRTLPSIILSHPGNL